MALCWVHVGWQCHVKTKCPAQLDIGVRHELDLGGRSFILGGEDVEDDAGLTLVSGSVRADDGVSATDGVSRPHKHVEDVHTPGPTSSDHKFLYGMDSLFEWHDDSNTVGQLCSPCRDDSWIKTIHDGSLENSDSNTLGDDDSDDIAEHGSDMILNMMVI